MQRPVFIAILLISVSLLGACDSLNFQPKDRITTANVPEGEEDVKRLLNGLYSRLRSNSIYNEGFFGFGIVDGATPNAFNWGSTGISRYARGNLSPEVGSFVGHRWTRAYSIINKANFFLQEIEKVELSDDKRSMYVGEAHFLRGFAYSVLANSYGKVPIITSVISSSSEARNLNQASVDEVWQQVISDYDVAIENLPLDAPQFGRADKGAALGLKMRAFLYQNKFDQVLTIANDIQSLDKYALFPSYDGLFELSNENNSEVMFSVQYMEGENQQGSLHDQYCGTGTGSWTRGTRYIATDDLVEAYEMAPEEHRLDPSNNFEVPDQGPYQGRDPRLYYTVVLPHTEILGHMFPSYIYEGGAYNHPGNRKKNLSARKYFIEDMSQLPPSGQSNLNYMLMRYADVILSKAEALIETGGSVEEAIRLINKIRTGREDVTLTELSIGMSRSEAREALRHERRIEFALEGIYWSDVKRWQELDGYAEEIYPLEVTDRNGNVVERKFPNGWIDHYKYLPIPADELALNENLSQNPGW